MLAAGGQHGELYITNAPPRTGLNASDVENKLAARFPIKPLKPFTINLSLQSRSINNSMILLPTYPDDWVRRSDERRIGHKPFRRHSLNYRTSQGVERGDEIEEEMDDIEELEDEVMDLDTQDGDDTDDDIQDDDAIGPRSPLTYPNTVPFLHGPRIPHLPSQSSNSDWMSNTGSGSGTPRRAASFSDRLSHRDRSNQVRPTRLERQSFSIPRPGTGLPPIEYVTSRPMGTPGSPRSEASSTIRRRSKRDLQRHGSVKGLHTHSEDVLDEPRLLISNNDLTVKMFSLRSTPNRPSASTNDTSSDPRLATRHQDPPAGVRNISGRRGGRMGAVSGGFERTFDDWTRGPDVLATSVSQRERLLRQLSEFQRIAGIRLIRDSALVNPQSGISPSVVPAPISPHGQKEKEERKLVRIGTSKFKCAINHCESTNPCIHTRYACGWQRS